MSTPENRSKMLMPQDPMAKDTPRSSKDPVNWAIHGGLPESFEGGKSSKKKMATDKPPTDLSMPVAETKLPPEIITHNEDGSTNEKHSANDQRFSNSQVADVQDASINSNTDIKVDGDKPDTTPPAPVNQDQNKPASTPDTTKPTTHNHRNKPAQAPVNDPSLKVR